MKELIELFDKKETAIPTIPEGYIKTCECMNFKIPDSIFGKVVITQDEKTRLRKWECLPIYRFYCPKCGIEFPKEGYI